MVKPKLGLCGITYMGLWYDGPALDIKGLIAKARHFGFTGVELDGKAPQALPYLLGERDRKEIVEFAANQGIDLVCIGGYNDFSSPVIEHRDANVQMVAEQIRLCRDLGIPILRIYTAWQGSSKLNGRGTYDVARSGYARAFPQIPEMIRWQYCLECFRIVARIAEDEGVILALQNHPPIVRNHMDCLEFVEEVNSPNFKISFDISGERAWQDTDWVLAAANRLGERWVRSAVGGDFKRNPDGIVSLAPLGRTLNPKEGVFSWNYDAWVQGMKEVGYGGYLLYEACTPTYLSNGNLVPLKVIDERVLMARDFLNQLLTRHFGE